MPFPLPIDPDFRKKVIWDWINDVTDRIDENLEGAEISWKYANDIYLSLPPGEGDEEIEHALSQVRVKLDN